MKAGELDQRITLQSLSEQNDSGSLTHTYTDAATVWAKVISQRGSEAFEAARTNAQETIRVGIRYRSDVTDKWRPLWLGQTYNIVAVDRSMARSGELWVTAQAVGAL